MELVQRSLRTSLSAFAWAFVLSAAYFALVFAWLGALPAGDRRLELPTYMLMLVVPMAASALLVAYGAKISGASTSVRTIQSALAALLAPGLAWYLVGFVSVLLTGEGF